MPPELVLETPVRCRLPPGWGDDPRIRKELAYEDGGVKHEWRSWRDVQLADDRASTRPNYRPHWFVARHGRDALDAKVAELDIARHKTVLQQDAAGWWTYSGLAASLAARFGADVVSRYRVPEAAPARWASCRLPFPLRAPQPEIVADFLSAPGTGPLGAEVATGVGKTAVFFELIRRLGLPALITTPSLSIVGQFYEQARGIFGDADVGRYFGSHHDVDQPIVIATTMSVGRARGAAAAALGRKSVLCGDESHTYAGEFLCDTVFGTLGAIPHRFFLSGSQLRGDGTGIILHGILGDVRRRVSVRDGVDLHRCLARPHFVQRRMRTPFPAGPRDPLGANRVHLGENEFVADDACRLVRQAAAKGFRPLIAISEISQFRLLLPRLEGLKIAFAHGAAPSKCAAEYPWMPETYRKSDPADLVDGFNRGVGDVFVGTPCVLVGTDFQTVDYIVDLIGLSSEVRIRQTVGRGTRIAGGKTDFYYVDYDVPSVEVMQSMAASRRKIFEEIYGPVTVT